MVNGIEVVYEPDEERNYRAIIGAADIAKLIEKDKELIGAISRKLEEIRG